MSPNYIIWDNEHQSDIIVEEIRIICQSTLNCAFYRPPIGFYKCVDCRWIWTTDD